MNLALFVTTENLASMFAFGEDFSRLQTENVNGGIAIYFEGHIPVADVQRLAALFKRRFPDGHIQPVSMNMSFTQEGRLASMMASFVLNSYSRYPGAWLVVDGPCAPSQENFMQLIHKAHNAGRGAVSGRGEIKAMEVVPVGPVVLELHHNDLKPLKSPMNESWRSRARFTFGRCGFRLISLDEYPFRIVAPTQVVPEEHPEDTQVRLLDELTDSDTPPDAEILGRYDLTTLSRNQLFNYLWWRSGKRPQVNIKTETLLSQIDALA